ncbi:hypothetical protein BJY16_005317 [Actinoplanes octamycinicus]|uniref:Uncharacterized protein n=1 Tax=Actinoplanes octamycinicus TaxID=135948 RepID=A0A7W7M9B8_9ACTN|nr:hypothetical protein [Actinoplanes octamycinicus]MBB4741858.1 hypothetical protein [Actinoplanes octamycinicus]GIE60622.1 hypothetical protein Aoc01nite_60240 [Actinoplanes octamycinicus]
MTNIDQYGRVRAAWQAAHRPVAGVPRWARIAANAVPLVVLPSGLWRLQFVFSDGGIGEKIYLVCLSIVAELLAFTAVGLIATWGERFPRWMPWAGGRPVPRLFAVVPATAAAIFLTVLWTVAFAAIFRDVTMGGTSLDPDFPTQGGFWEASMFYVCYLPLLLWGPLLGAVTFAYWRRRSQHGAE